MKNQINNFLILPLSLLLLINVSGCKKDEAVAKTTLQKLYITYQNGEISEHQYKGETVYGAGLNAYDAGSVIYNIEGKQIGTCNDAWGTPDAICKQLTEGEVIYRVKDNIWGQPAVDKYGLGK